MPVAAVTNRWDADLLISNLFSGINRWSSRPLIQILHKFSGTSGIVVSAPNLWQLTTSVDPPSNSKELVWLLLLDFNLKNDLMSFWSARGTIFLVEDFFEKAGAGAGAGAVIWVQNEQCRSMKRGIDKLLLDKMAEFNWRSIDSSSTASYSELSQSHSKYLAFTIFSMSFLNECVVTI